MNNKIFDCIYCGKPAEGQKVGYVHINRQDAVDCPNTFPAPTPPALDAERDALCHEDWHKDASKVQRRTEWLLGWGRGYDASLTKLREVTDLLRDMRSIHACIMDAPNEITPCAICLKVEAALASREEHEEK